jgi:ABC-type nitrate/sulfonate/bicarbonate transport system substrate-binding protein
MVKKKYDSFVHPRTSRDLSRPKRVKRRMKKKGIIALTVGFAAVLTVLAFILLKRNFSPEKTERLRIGILPDAYNALLYVAREKGMFKRHGVDLSLENFQAGAYAVESLLSGKIDAATASEFVLAIRAFSEPNLRAVATLCTSSSIEVVARKDRGIEKPQDLRGKRVGASKGTNAMFFLNAFLSLNGVHPAEIRVIDLKPADIVVALVDGRIDAAINHVSYIEEVKRRLGENVTSWSAQGGQETFILSMTRDEVIRTRPRAITGLLRGALDAEEFLKKHEMEAQTIIRGALSLAPDAVMASWPKTRFRVRLDQDILTLMEDEGRWAVRNKLVEAEKIPNYFTFLHVESLERIKPEAVGVIH